jgi:TolB protein
MGRRFIVAIAFALTFAGCTDDSTNGTTTSTETPEPSTTSTVAEPVHTGRLAIIDSEGDVVVMSPDGSDRLEITVNGGTDNPAIYMQPVWSPDGSTLSWGQTTGTGFGVGISRPGTGLITTLSTPNLPFFTHWSPTGRHLGVLHNGASGVQFQIADIEAEATEILDEDAPFYFSWSPLGDRVVTHAGESRVETITPNGERVELEPTTANYLSPQWTEVGVFHVVEDRLVLEDENGERDTIASVAGLTLFVSNPSGSLVAVQVEGGDGSGITASTEEFPTATIDALVVIDVEAGEVDVVESSSTLGFFWSPDGESLLALTAEESQIVPVVWTADGETTDYTPFRPPPSMVRETLAFFPQYAQSVRFFSPESTAFAFAGQVGDETGIWVQDVSGGPPARVSDGSWVAWSPASP